MGENDFVLNVGADLSGFQKSIDSVFKNYANKTLNIDVKAKLDPSLKKVLSTFQNSKGRGNSSSTNALIGEERRAAKAANTLAVSLQSASRNVELFAIKMTKAANIRFSPVGAMGAVAAGGKNGLLGGAFGKMERGLLMLPGLSQLVGYGRQAVGSLTNFGKSALSAYDNQILAETQLRQVLKNNNMGEDAFNTIKSHAGALQSRTTIGDEAMLAGAGELATYVKDPAQMKRMMNLLSNYAIGMNAGNPEVSQQQMVEFATGLGKAFDGTYDSMRKKGFDTSELEALSKLEKEGKTVSDSQKISALERALKDWDGLAEKIAQTDKGKLVQLQNTIGDMKETVGESLYPAVGRLADAIKKNLPSIEKFFNSIGKFLVAVVENLSAHADAIALAGDALSSLISKVSDYLMPSMAGLSAAFGVLAVSSTKATAGILKNAAGLVTSGDSMAKSIGSLGGTIGNIVKGGLIGVLVAEIALIGDAAWQAWKASREARENLEKEAKRTENKAPMLEAHAKYKEALKSQNAGDIITYRRDLEGQAQAYFSKTGQVPSYIAEELGWDVAALRGENSSPSPGAKPPSPPPPKVSYVTQNISVSTDFDSLGKLIKENLREIAISRMTFKTSAESAKAYST